MAEQISDIAELENSISQLSGKTTSLVDELNELSDEFKIVNEMSNELSKILSQEIVKSIKDVMDEGKSLSSVMKGLTSSMANKVVSKSFEPVSNEIGNIFEGWINQTIRIPFGNTAAKSQSNYSTAFLKGDTRRFSPSLAHLETEDDFGDNFKRSQRKGKFADRPNLCRSPININFQITTQNASSFLSSRREIEDNLLRAFDKANRRK